MKGSFEKHPSAEKAEFDVKTISRCWRDDSAIKRGYPSPRCLSLVPSTLIRLISSTWNYSSREIQWLWSPQAPALNCVHTCMCTHREVKVIIITNVRKNLMHQI